MSSGKLIWDTVIIGGGLAGLSASILLARKGYSVLLLEKDNYPRHKVCGEYISMESWSFLNSLLTAGLEQFGASRPNLLLVTSQTGREFRQSLVPGGFGISRFVLDDALKSSAINAGVTVRENSKVESAELINELFTVTSGTESFHARTCLAAFGKRSNLDVKWRRPFVQTKPGPLNNYVGVKYHVRGPFNKHEIALHNFAGGYCGLCAIEEDKFNLCYLVKASQLRKSSNSFEHLEATVMSANTHLRSIFDKAQKLDQKPVTISQISFSKKAPVEKGMLCIGDAGGMITPLCGNGMSIALHCGKLAAEATTLFLENALNRAEMEQRYGAEWKKNFGNRVKTGRVVQSILNNRLAGELFISMMKGFPKLAEKVIDRTHGESF